MSAGAWVLVLTVITGKGSQYPPPVGIERLDGFHEQTECLAAGKKWGDAMMKILPPGGKATAVCVRLWPDTRILKP